MGIYKIQFVQHHGGLKRLDGRLFITKKPIPNTVSVDGTFGLVVTDRNGCFYRQGEEEDIRAICVASGVYEFKGKAGRDEYGVYLDYVEKVDTPKDDKGKELYPITYPAYEAEEVNRKADKDEVVKAKANK